MKKTFLTIFFVAILLVTTGAGCSIFGSKKTTDISKNGGIYKSTDSGLTWRQITAFPSSKGVGNIGTTKVNTLTIDPQDHRGLYIGTPETGLLFSYNSGDSWQSPQDSLLQSGSVTSVTVDYKNMCTVYATLGSYLYKTETCGRKFIKTYDETRSGVTVKRVLADWYNQGVVYLGLSNGDILKSLDYGLNWTKLKSLNKNLTTMVLSNQDSRILLVGTDSGLFKTSDAGATWEDKSEVLEKFSNGSNVYRMVQDAAGSTFLMATEYGLLRSTDAGDNWASVKLLTSPNQITIYALTLNPKDPNIIYYASSSTFYKSIDGGASWDTQKLTGGWAPTFLVSDPEEPTTLYMGRQMLETK
ncbi:MAG: YCF48-related protein [Candidatus Uhrbacteria bacterium]